MNFIPCFASTKMHISHLWKRKPNVKIYLSHLEVLYRETFDSVQKSLENAKDSSKPPGLERGRNGRRRRPLLWIYGFPGKRRRRKRPSTPPDLEDRCACRRLRARRQRTRAYGRRRARLPFDTANRGSQMRAYGVANRCAPKLAHGQGRAANRLSKGERADMEVKGTGPG